MNNFSHQENPVNSHASTDSFIRRRRGAVRKQNVHEVKKNFESTNFFSVTTKDILVTIIVESYFGDAETRMTQSFWSWQQVSIKSGFPSLASPTRVSEDWTWYL